MRFDGVTANYAASSNGRRMYLLATDARRWADCAGPMRAGWSLRCDRGCPTGWRNVFRRNSFRKSSISFEHRAARIWQKSDLNAFAVASGPGSFTGLRIRLAAIKGLGEDLGKTYRPHYGCSIGSDGEHFQPHGLLILQRWMPAARKSRRNVQLGGGLRGASWANAYAGGVARCRERLFILMKVVLAAAVHYGAGISVHEVSSQQQEKQ